MRAMQLAGCCLAVAWLAVAAAAGDSGARRRPPDLVGSHTRAPRRSASHSRADVPHRHDMAGTGCSGTVTLRQPSASFSDGPGAYAGGQTCDWLIAPYSVRPHAPVVLATAVRRNPVSRVGALRPDGRSQFPWRKGQGFPDHAFRGSSLFLAHDTS